MVFVHDSVNPVNILSFNILITVNETCYHLQAVFFSELYASENRKLIERLVNYVIYKVSAFMFHWFNKHVTVTLFLLLLTMYITKLYIFLKSFNRVHCV